MVKIIMGVGLPGSGKTTILKPFAEKNSYIYISPDDIRAELLGNAADQSKNREIWQEAYNRVEKALSEGNVIVFDATFAKDLERKNFIQFVRTNGATKVQGVVTEVPLEIANERNRARERVVPDYAMERMNMSLKKVPPSIKEGFDSLFFIDESQELKRIEVGKERGIQTKEFKIK